MKKRLERERICGLPILGGAGRNRAKNGVEIDQRLIGRRRASFSGDERSFSKAEVISVKHYGKGMEGRY